MISPSILLAFGAATLALLVLPGPAVLYIVTRSATQGRLAGLVSVAGIHVGTLVHIAAAMVGLSALLAASATAFTAVKLAGAAYLVWLGVSALLASRRHGTEIDTAEVEHRPLGRVFLDAVVVNVLNPKTAIFFLSFVPQFIDPNAANPTWHLAQLGALFIILGVLSDGLFALLGGWAGARLTGSVASRRRQDTVAGTTYLGLGAFTTWSALRSSG
ncbi:MAG: LysE family translocator [Actinomycetota bacterium]